MTQEHHREEATMPETPTHDALRELAHRESDGIDVTLFWDAQRNSLTVSVIDAKTGAVFTLDAARDKALDVFYHPFSYATSPHAPHTNLLLAA